MTPNEKRRCPENQGRCYSNKSQGRQPNTPSLFPATGTQLHPTAFHCPARQSNNLFVQTRVGSCHLTPPSLSSWRCRCCSGAVPARIQADPGVRTVGVLLLFAQEQDTPGLSCPDIPCEVPQTLILMILSLERSEFFSLEFDGAHGTWRPATGTFDSSSVLHEAATLLATLCRHGVG